MTYTQIKSLAERAADAGLNDIPDEIDTDGCGCETCFEEAEATLRLAA